MAKGDLIRITRGGKSLDGKHRVYNGNVFKLQRFDREGNLVLQNGWKLDKSFGHVSPGYVVTSHSSQGKTVDNVMLVESQSSYAAASREQLYVSVSRGRKNPPGSTRTILQDFKEAVNRSDERITATELLRRQSRSERQRRIHLANRIDNENKLRINRKVRCVNSSDSQTTYLDSLTKFDDKHVEEYQAFSFGRVGHSHPSNGHFCKKRWIY